MASSRSPLVLFQVPNRIGLGHMNRMACIALALRDLKPEIRVLFVVEGAAHGLLESFDLPYVAVPFPGVVYQTEAWRAWSQFDRWRMMSAMTSSILVTSRPDLVVFDCFPSMHFIQIVPCLGIKSMLCIRKVKNFEEYASDPAVRRSLETAASLLIPHWEEEFSIPDSLRSRATYVGPIVKAIPATIESPQKRFNLTKKRVIVICAGGGGGEEAVDFFNMCVGAFSLVKNEVQDLAALLVTGPLFRRWSKLELASDVRVTPFDSRFSSTCAAADLVISQAGYNSINELASTGTPTICIPVERVYDDQIERAHRMAAEYSNIDCFEGRGVEDLADLIKVRLKAGATYPRGIFPDGAYRAAMHVIDQLDPG